ncbi:MAG: thioesterase family protein [Actinomycetota bacterium]
MFRQEGSEFVPSELTRGGWSNYAQHGSPPAGLLGRALEGIPTSVPMQVVRFTVDLFREVPLRPLRVDTRLVRDGRRIQVAEAALLDGDREVGRATALKIRTVEMENAGEVEGTGGEDPPPRPGPERLTSLDWRDFFGPGGDATRFHTDGVDIRTVDGSFIRPVPGESWFRLLTPLVAGEEMTPFQRAATSADLANGNSQALDPKRWLYVNPDTTLYLHRLPVGEWIGMRSIVHQTRQGIGVTETALYDPRGRIGHISQAQILERR